MDASSRTLLVRLLSTASCGLMSIMLIGFGLFSMNRVGPSGINIGIAAFAIVQAIGLIGRKVIALRMVAIELLLLAVLQLSFYFAPTEGGMDWQVSLGWRVCMFSLGVLVLVVLSGACFEDARLLAAERIAKSTQI